MSAPCTSGHPPTVVHRLVPMGGGRYAAYCWLCGRLVGVVTE